MLLSRTMFLKLKLYSLRTGDFFGFGSARSWKSKFDCLMKCPELTASANGWSSSRAAYGLVRSLGTQPNVAAPVSSSSLDPML